MFTPQRQVQAQDNNSELYYRKWRVTLFPPLSTNGLEAVDYTARNSINILAGYHGGLDGWEVGGLLNYTKEYARGFQLAGVMNATGGDMAGANIAGIANYAKKDMGGIQLAAIANLSARDLEGIQLAGAFNIAGGTSGGLQFAGIGNIAKENIEGLQGAGGWNIAGDDISGLQASGVTNIALENIEGLMATGGINFASKDASGLLLAGGLNITRNLEGAAFSGLGNIAKTMSGLQFSPLLNASEKATGLQIGLVNVAKEFNGVPVGFISFYGNGRKNIDLRYSDGGFTDIGFTLGTYRVYNSALFGYNTLLNRNVYRIGMAVGLEKNITDAFPKWVDETIYVNQELSVTHQFEEEWSRDLNMMYSYKYLLGKRFGNGLSLYGGPTFNMQISRLPESADYTWYSLWSPEWRGRDYRFWVGFTAGIRLFKQPPLPRLRDEYRDWR